MSFAAKRLFTSSTFRAKTQQAKTLATQRVVVDVSAAKLFVAGVALGVVVVSPFLRKTKDLLGEFLFHGGDCGYG